MILLMQLNSYENNIDTDLINVGSNEEVSILELAKEIKSVVGFEGELI